MAALNLAPALDLVEEGEDQGLAASIFDDADANKLGKCATDRQYKLIALCLFTLEEQTQ